MHTIGLTFFFYHWTHLTISPFEAIAFCTPSNFNLNHHICEISKQPTRIKKDFQNIWVRVEIDGVQDAFVNPFFFSILSL